MGYIEFISFLVFVTSSLVYGVLIIAGLDLLKISPKIDCFGSLFIGVQSKLSIQYVLGLAFRIKPFCVCQSGAIRCWLCCWPLYLTLS